MKIVHFTGFPGIGSGIGGGKGAPIGLIFLQGLDSLIPNPSDVGKIGKVGFTTPYLLLSR